MACTNTTPGRRFSGLLARLMIAGLGVLLLHTAVYAADECQDCLEDQFPEAAAFLEAHGFPPQDYTVLLSWQERGRHLGAGLITGYRLAPVHGGEPFDLYSSESGELLSEEFLADAGIKPKQWALPPAEQLPEVSEQIAKLSEPRPRAVGPARGAEPGEWLLLEPIDMGKVIAEDLDLEAGPLKAAKRIGVFQEFPQAVEVRGDSATVGEWQTLADGTRIWTIRIFSPDAVAQRVHFARLELPRGAEVIVYNPSHPEEAYGPYTGLHPGETGLWAASCFAEAVAVECVVPDGVPLQSIRLVIDKTAHIYANFATLQWTKGLNDAGWCNLDVACYDEWLETSWGVGGVGSISSGVGVLWCTGSLIADSDPDTQIPYFLTAHHCVGTESGANSVEIYWLWQRDGCGGPIIPSYNAPRTTGGADLLVSSPSPNLAENGSDFTLLRLRNQPPAGVTYLGWSTAPQTVGTDISCIHHPSGDYKRISFGDIIPSPVYPSSMYRVAWNEGTTEPGSSGSPLLLADTQQIIGQLWRGTASCSMTRERGGWDEYGRFDITYPLVKSWLDPVEPAGPEDINKDGVVDAVDVQLVVNAAIGIPIPYDANVSGDPDGRVTAVDVQMVINAALRF